MSVPSRTDSGSRFGTGRPSGRAPPPLSLTPQQRSAPVAVTRRDHQRATIVLKRAEGVSQATTARELGVSRPVVIKWERLYVWRKSSAQILAGIRRARQALADLENVNLI